MDVYLPSATKPRPLPVAVHVHGGGWVSGSRSTGERFAALKDELLDRGYMVASLDYRLGPAHKYPAQIQDVKCAIRHLRARAARYGLDADRIGAWGGSAGGQLVALLGTADASAGFDDAGGFQAFSSEVQAVAAISAITDFTATGELFDDYSRAFETWPDPTSPEMIEASPVTHVSAGDSPFFFLVGDEDALVSPAQSERMDQRLRQAGVESSLLRVLHADHDLNPTSEPTDPSQAAIVNSDRGFLRRPPALTQRAGAPPGCWMTGRLAPGQHTHLPRLAPELDPVIHRSTGLRLPLVHHLVQQGVLHFLPQVAGDVAPADRDLDRAFRCGDRRSARRAGSASGRTAGSAGC